MLHFANKTFRDVRRSKYSIALPFILPLFSFVFFFHYLLSPKTPESADKLCQAVSAGDVNSVSELLRQKVNPNTVGSLYELIDGDREPVYTGPPLGIAVSRGGSVENQVAIVNMLLNNGADVNEKDENGDSPLSLCDEPAFANILLSHGAQIESKDKDGKTALYLATDRVNIRMLRTLVSVGANVNAKGNDGRTPLDVVDSSDATIHIDQENYKREKLRCTQCLESHGAKHSEKPSPSIQKGTIEYGRGN